MFKSRVLGEVLQNNIWSSLAPFSLILFFIFLGDAILSYWVPNFLQDSLGSPLLMGITMSFSSFIGFGADIIFPQLLKGYTVSRLLRSAILVSFSFIICLALGLQLPVIGVFLIAMAIWGIYYEFIGFASQQFVADTIPLKSRSTSWAIIDIFKNLSYFLGPIIAGYILVKGEPQLLAVVSIFVGIGFTVYILSRKKHERVISIEAEKVNIWREISHWKTLFPRVWTILLLSLAIGLIDATFWTTGAVWTEKLSRSSFAGSLILPAYQLPSLFAGLVLFRLGIFKGKKKIAEKLILVSGLVLCLLVFNTSVPVTVLVIFISSTFLALAFPLIEAVYSDITSRMGVERKHFVGLSASTISLAYIISPSIAGYLADNVGERTTFVLVGFMTVVVSLVLLIFTPKKIHLPEKEIVGWKA